jgi:hypothetical protein
MRPDRTLLVITTLIALILGGCGFSSSQTESGVFDSSVKLDASNPNLLQAVEPQPSPTSTSTPQPIATLADFGPGATAFPANYNPLTGLPVMAPSLLKLPALLVSITHFPPQARPQGGLSYAPWVFEYLISSGSTRFLAVFYGDYPHREVPVIGDCKVRSEPFVQNSLLLGNRVWLDLNADGLQDPGEPGVGGVCVDLMDADSDETLAQTTSDSNGYYAFNVETGKSYRVAFKPGKLEFSPQNVGDENHDSDVDPGTGLSAVQIVSSDNLLLDAGLLQPRDTISSESPTGQVGPVRSARLVNIHIQNSFQDSCLIYAGSTREIRDLIPGCAEVFTKGDGGVGSMLDISRLVSIAEDNARKRNSNFNYTSNRFVEQVPAGGQQVIRLDEYVSELNQSAWVYDPSVQGWLRYVDDAKKEHAGILHPDTDRLTGRQIAFENIIVLYVEHKVLALAIIDMYLRQGESEDALLFRDGRMFKIKWSTRAGEYEQQTGLRRPISFQDKDGHPFPLHPGRTWIIIATPYSQLSTQADGELRLRIIAPTGAGDY